jgi:predicted naringenin-chalcone synthase
MGGAQAMTWKNSADPGRFEMWLSKDIPAALRQAFQGARGFSILHQAGIRNPLTCAWALHPGGAGIIRSFR